jgi:hypothetical protein
MSLSKLVLIAPYNSHNGGEESAVRSPVELHPHIFFPSSFLSPLVEKHASPLKKQRSMVIYLLSQIISSIF